MEKHLHRCLIVLIGSSIIFSFQLKKDYIDPEFYPVEAVKYIKENNIQYKILGNGSNLIFVKPVYEGILIKLSEFDDLKIQKNVIEVGAGYNLMKLALKVSRMGLTGLEFATGIPGSIGGAVYMNAGAYNSDMGYVVSKIKVLTPDLKVITMVNSELDFHYRSSFFLLVFLNKTLSQKRIATLRDTCDNF